MNHFENKRIAIVGGGSGIGKAIAEEIDRQGGDAILSSRNVEKLKSVAATLQNATPLPVDMTDDASVRSWANELPQIDHLVISASSAVHGRFDSLDISAVRTMFDAKFFGPYQTAKMALDKLRDGGSITFFSGILSRRPGINCTGLGAVNGAVESLCYGLALELGPRLRVNCVSPGMIRSDAYAKLDAEKREAMYEATGESLPVGRVGTVDEAALSAIYLMQNSYSSGVVLDVDGGHMIRQYAHR